METKRRSESMNKYCNIQHSGVISLIWPCTRLLEWKNLPSFLLLCCRFIKHDITSDVVTHLSMVLYRATSHVTGNIPSATYTKWSSISALLSLYNQDLIIRHWRCTIFVYIKVSSKSFCPLWWPHVHPLIYFLPFRYASEGGSFRPYTLNIYTYICTCIFFSQPAVSSTCSECV